MADIDTTVKEVLITLARCSVWCYSDLEFIYLKTASIDKVIDVMKLGTSIPLCNAIISFLSNCDYNQTH